MKNIKIIALAVLAATSSQVAMAEQTHVEDKLYTSIEKVENHTSVNTKLGQKDMKTIGYDSFNYGLGVENTTTINDRHHVTFGIEGERTMSDHYSIGKDEIRQKGYGVNANYKYDIPVNYALTVSPLVGVGYETSILKSNGDRSELNRSYGEVGAEAQYTLQNGWLLNPSLTFQRDINAKEKNNNVHDSSPSWGHKYEVEFGVEKELTNGSNISVAPYYAKYKNKSNATTESNFQKEVQDSGVKVKFEY